MTQAMTAADVPPPSAETPETAYIQKFLIRHSTEQHDPFVGDQMRLAATWLASLERERDALRAEVERVKAENAALREGKLPRWANEAGEGHVHTDRCGFDRNASHNAGHYVCACGWGDDAAQPKAAGIPVEPKPLPFAPSDAMQAWIDYAIALRAEVEGVKAEWFRKGQEAVKRRNESGCCCLLEDGEIVTSPCDAHKAWRDAALQAGKEPKP